jgi:hypothetical protein
VQEADDMKAMPTVSGLAQIIASLRLMAGNVPYKAMQPAINKAAQYAAKQVKASVPGRYKSVRKAIGWRAKKKKFNRGEPGAKVGAGVGRSRATTQKERKGRPGVGIDARNVHWWFLGTDTRYTGTKRKRVGGRRGRRGWKGKATRIDTGKMKANRGFMPAQSQPIDVIVSRAAGGMKTIIRTWVAVGIKREAERAAKKGRRK